jgi:hypothetical protein
VHCPAGERNPKQCAETRSQALWPPDSHGMGGEAGEPADESVAGQGSKRK